MTSATNGSEGARQTQDVRLVVHTIPTLAWSAHADDSADFFNRMAVAEMAMPAGLSYTALRDAILTHPTMAEGLNPLFSSIKPANAGATSRDVYLLKRPVPTKHSLSTKPMR